MFNRRLTKSNVEPANESPPNPTQNSQDTPAGRQLLFVVVGDEVRVLAARQMTVRVHPTAAMHVPSFLQWLSATPCAGKWVYADHINQYLYPEFCGVHGLEPKPVQTVFKSLKTATRKRIRDILARPFVPVRKVQYFIPKYTRVKAQSRHK